MVFNVVEGENPNPGRIYIPGCVEGLRGLVAGEPGVGIQAHAAAPATEPNYRSANLKDSTIIIKLFKQIFYTFIRTNKVLCLSVIQIGLSVHCKV